MSLREVSSSKPLLAKKGRAAPTNPGAVRVGPAEPSLRPIESDGEVSPESATAEAAAGLEAKAAGKRKADGAPAASLLPFNLLRQKYSPDASPDLAEDEPDIAPADFAAAPAIEPRQPAELVLRAEPKLAADADPSAPVGDKPALELKIPRPLDDEADPRLEAPALAPTPNPDWRVGAEETVRPKRTSGGGWLLPLGALAAAFAVLAVGWNMANPDLDLGFGSAPDAMTAEDAAGDPAAPISVAPPPPVAEPPAAADPAPVDLPPSPAPAESTAAGEPQPPAPTPLESSMPAPILDPPADATQPAEASTQADRTVPAPDQAAAPQQAASQQAGAPATSAPVKPTVDVVRLEPSGEAVIAGRAAPNTELIVLDNGKPIGSVRADPFGDWVFVPDVPLPAGDHEFGLVVKTVQETVNLPAPSKPSLPPAPEPEAAVAAPEPAPVTPSDAAPIPAPGPTPAEGSDAEAGGAPDVAPAAGVDGPAAQSTPVPARKPEPATALAAPTNDQTGQLGMPATKTADFVIQLASVKTRAGAEEEWRKLQRRFPEILSDMVPALDEVKLADLGTVIRVRTGAFDSQHEAANLCAQFAAKRQACLVVKTSGGN